MLNDKNVIKTHVKNVINQFMVFLKSKNQEDNKVYWQDKNYIICAMLNQFDKKYQKMVNQKVLSSIEVEEIYSIVSDIFFMKNEKKLFQLADNDEERNMYITDFYGLLA